MKQGRPRNKDTIIEAIKKKGKKTPLDFMLAVMWNKEATLGARLEAAKCAAPYVHRKMPLEIANTGEVTLVTPKLPSRITLAEDFRDEMDDDFLEELDNDTDDL
jgi:hypothetical protein